MNAPRLFMILTFVTAATTIAAVAENILNRPEAAPRAQEDFGWSKYLVEGSAGSFHSGQLVTGVSQTVPDLAAIPRLDEIPWERRAIADHFDRAGTFASCDILEPNIDVVQPLVSVPEEISAPIGRLGMFSIGLQVDPEVEDLLPTVTKGAIKDYLKDHMLNVQAPLYRYPDGRVFFGEKMKAAFFAKAMPKRSMTPEAMIANAIAEFRTLGIYKPANDDDAAALPKPAAPVAEEGTEDSEASKGSSPKAPLDDLRTLILAFRYTIDMDNPDVPGGNQRRREYELLFLHLLPEHTAQRPAIAVFATSDGRTIFHELQLDEQRAGAGEPEITADIRFEEFTMLGMYPTRPVVTGVHQQTRLSIPVTTLQGRLMGLLNDRPMTLDEVLDDLHASSGNNDAPTPTAAEL